MSEDKGAGAGADAEPTRSDPYIERPAGLKRFPKHIRDDPAKLAACQERDRETKRRSSARLAEKRGEVCWAGQGYERPKGEGSVAHLRMSQEMRAELELCAKALKLPITEVMRRMLEKGIPVVLKNRRAPDHPVQSDSLDTVDSEADKESSKVVHLHGDHIPGTVNQEVVDLLETLLGRAKRGEIVALAAQLVRATDDVTVAWSSPTANKHTLLAGIAIGQNEFMKSLAEEFST